MDSLVSTEWLEKRLSDPDLVVADATLFMPGAGKNARASYLAAHIPGARFLDIEELSDHRAAHPHTMPTALQFGQAMEELGIGQGDCIVVYDSSPLRSAARGWFMLRYFGAERVAILDGGLGKWIAEGRPLDHELPGQRRAFFDAREQDKLVTKDELLEGQAEPWIDARSQARFQGLQADPRPGVAAGHAPGSRNLPFDALYRDDGRFRTVDELEKVFAQAGVDPRQSFVASCGSGVTANSLIFAAHLLGNDNTRLYDGSWSDWGSDPRTPKAIGPA